LENFDQMPGPKGLNYIHVVIALPLIAVLFSAACEQRRPAPPDQVDTNVQPAANGAQPPPQVIEKAVNITVTLPILDALLADQTFVSEAKTAAQLSDEEVQKLRDAARNAVLKLTEDPSENDLRSTRSAIARGRKEIERILGEGRTETLLALAQKRWASGDQQFEIEPNQVPTDTRVVVNAPAYRMDLFRDGKLIRSYKIGIGYPEFPLPAGLRKIEKIIFNPTWTPPDEPWVKGKFQPGKTVEAGDKLNPLGVIKIPIGLPSLIHGGKSPDRLGTFASHGCVGLTNALVQDVAVQISSVAGKPISLEEIKAYEKQKNKTEEVDLDREIPVELRYETIVLENGVLKIYRDVYEKGTNTEERLKRVLEQFGASFDGFPAALRQKILEGLSRMAIDAGGQPVDTGDAKPAAKKNDERVTKNIRGKKELSFELPGMAGKGYPAPVGDVGVTSGRRERHSR
jgi:lipoprotein-anchoring transpeptidase ErfK/SrfK